MKFKTKLETTETYKKSFKFYLPLTQVKKNKINQHLENYRQLYNHCREERLIAWEENQREVDYYEQQNSLSQIVEKLPLLEKVNSQVRQDVVRRADQAWQKFYSRFKENKKLRNKLIWLINQENDPLKATELKESLTKLKEVKPPRYKQVGRYDSFTHPQNIKTFKIKGNQLWLSKLGWMSVEFHRELEGEIKTCSILVKNERYYVIFTCKVECKPKMESKTIPLSKHIGADLNTSDDNLIVLSNGEKISNPQFLKTVEPRLKPIYQSLDHKQHKRNKEDKIKPSNGYQKTKLQLAKECEKIANQRKDFTYQEVSKLLKVYDFFGVEKLKINKMIKNNTEKGKWYSVKRMYDSSLSSIYETLIFKAEDAGKWVIPIDPRNTSQTCSNCWKKTTKRLGLEDRIFICAYCGFKLDRDVNASKNILRKAHMKEFGTDFVRQAHAF